MTNSDSSIELRYRLVAYATRRGFSVDEAEDLAGEAWVKSRRASEDEEAPAYAFHALKSLMTDRWCSPGRVLAKRIDLLIARPSGTDPVIAWSAGASKVIGFKSMRNAQPVSVPSVNDLSIADFLYGNRGLGGVSPLDLATRHVLERFLSWLGRPIERLALISLLAPIVVAPREIVGLDWGDEPTVQPAEMQGTLEGFWDHIAGLPTPKMRASILLAMEEDLLESINPRARGALEVLISGWSPPPPLCDLELPADDGVVATKLGITKGDLQISRNRARKILQRALAAFLDIPETRPTAGRLA